MIDNVFDVEKECYKIVTEAGWQLKELYPVLSKSMFYKLGLNALTYDEIFLKAFHYAKKCDYADRIISRIIRKNENGKELAIKLFNAVFPEFHSFNELYSYCYNASKDDIKKVSLMLEINIPFVRYYASESKEYKEQQRINSIKKQQELRDKEPVYCQTIDFLLRTRDEEEIIKFCDNIREKLKYKKLYDIACILYPYTNFSSLGLTLKRRYNIYLSSLTKRKHNENAIIIIERFVNNNDNVHTFCEKENISIKNFWKLLRIVAQTKPELYQKYELKKGPVVKDFNIIKKIIQYINYGIDDREFNIIDYFKLTKRSVHSFFMTAKPYIDDKEYDAVVKFYGQYNNLIKYNVNAILKERIEINCELDNNNMPIPNTGHVITNDEKKAIIEKIKNEGLPLYQPIYKYYLDEYFNNPKENVLKKIR